MHPGPCRVHTASKQVPVAQSGCAMMAGDASLARSSGSSLRIVLVQLGVDSVGHAAVRVGHCSAAWS